MGAGVGVSRGGCGNRNWGVGTNKGRPIGGRHHGGGGMSTTRRVSERPVTQELSDHYPAPQT